jgi:hypothetical protein
MKPQLSIRHDVFPYCQLVHLYLSFWKFHTRLFRFLRYFLSIIKRFSRPGEKCLVHMDINSTIMFGDLIANKDESYVLTSAMFEGILVTPKSSLLGEEGLSFESILEFVVEIIFSLNIQKLSILLVFKILISQMISRSFD